MQQETPPSVDTWASLNGRFLEIALERLRLLLRRKVLWLRAVWEDDPLEGYQGQVVSDARADRALRGRHAAGEEAFYQQNEEARSIGKELGRIQTELDRHRQNMRKAGVVPALDLVGRMFGLTTFERDVLLLCLAPEIDPSFQKLYAYVQDDPAKKYATPHLAIGLLTGTFETPDDRPDPGREEARDSFGPHGALRRFQLIQAADDRAGEIVRSARPIRLDERVAAYLRGENRMDEHARVFLRAVEPLPVPPDHETVIERMTSVLSARLEEGTRPAVHLTGPEVSGKRAAARELSSRLSLDLYRLDVGRLPSSAAERRKVLRLLEREAVLLQAAYFVNAADLDDGSESAEEILEDVIEDLDATLFVAGGEVGGFRRKQYAISLPKSDTAVQQELWGRVLGDAGVQLNGRAADIAQQFDFGPGRMARAVASARNQAELEGHAGELAARDLWQACRRQAGSEMSELAREIEPTYRWEDIVLPEDTFDQLREIAAQVSGRARVYGEWGFEDRLSRGLGISALFAGPSGTGKTMAAEILANHLELDLYRIDLASMVSKYIGETEKNLKKVFDAAERSGAILFFDEADALFGKRTEVSDSHDRYANIEVDYLLQRMEEYRGLAVLATNRKGDLDRAFLRRLRFIVDFPPPDTDHRRMIWEKAFPEKAPVGDLDYAFLSRLEITGANIQNIALNAAFLAAENDTSIEMDYVMHAARREYEKIGKLVTESEFGGYYDRE